MNFLKILVVLLIICSTKVFSDMPNVYCRYEYENEIHYGEVVDNLVYELDAEPWLGGSKTGHFVDIEEVKLLHPTKPQVILGLGRAYKNSWEGKTPFKTVRWFLKPPSSAASPGEEIILPKSLDEVKVETELVIVIGKKVKDADEKTAADAIFGYTIGNDIMGNADSYHRIEGEPLDTKENLLGPGLKIGDKFAPFGPFIYTGIEWQNRDWSLVIENDKTNKKLVHKDNTSNLVYPPAKIVSDLSKMLTLNPGDIIFSGTSKSMIAGNGDVVTVTIDGLGTLINRIIVK